MDLEKEAWIWKWRKQPSLWICAWSVRKIEYWFRNETVRTGRESPFPVGMLSKANRLQRLSYGKYWKKTGLAISALRLCCIKDWYRNDLRYVVLLYRTEHFSGMLHSSDEGKVWWEDIKQLSRLKLAGNLGDMLHVFVGYGLSEFFVIKMETNGFMSWNISLFCTFGLISEKRYITGFYYFDRTDQIH